MSPFHASRLSFACAVSVFAGLFALIGVKSALAAPGADTAPPSEAPVIKLTSGIALNGTDDGWSQIPLAGTVQGNQGEIADFKLGYNPTTFYALITVRDDSPLKNSGSAGEPAMILKTGDAVGLTFGPSNGQGAQQRILFAEVAGQPLAVVYRPAWPEKKPYTFTSPVGTYTPDYAAPLPDAKVAFKLVPGGYNAEIAIPWGVLGYTPRDGLSFPFDLQVILSDPAGQTNAATAWWHSVGAGPLSTVDLPTEARLYPELWGTARLYLTPPVTPATPPTDGPPQGVAVHYVVPRAAKVSLDITDSNGWILRELMVARPHVPGAYTTYWDGRDEYGDPLPPGKYLWKALIFDGIGSKRVGGAGNSARPPFRTPDGKGDLGAVHGFPAALAADATGVYHLSGTEEGNPGLTKLSPDGFALWKRSLGGYGNGVEMAATDKFACMIVGVGGRTMLDTLDPATGADLAVGTKGARFDLGDEKLPLAGLALLGQKAYYGLPATNEIGVWNLGTGASETAIPFTAPVALCALDDTHLLAVTGSSVLKLDVTTGQTAPFLSGLDQPHAVTRDAAGDVFVAQWGQSQQIQKYSPTGALLASWGSKGGRPATALPYQPDALWQVKSLCVAPDGNVWFMEDSNLRRSGVLDVNGHFVREEFQTLPSQAGAGVDLDDPERVFFHTAYDSTVVQAHVDFAADAKDPANPASYWKVEAVYNLTSAGDYTPAGPDDMAAASTRGPFYNPIAFTGTNGKHYLWQEGDIASLWMLENGKMVPVQVIGSNRDGTSALFSKGKKFTWSDTNGDGKMSADEIEFDETGDDGWRWIDRDLTLYGNGGSLKPYKVDARGVPYYHRADWKPEVTQGKPVSYYFRDGSYGIFPSPPAPDGARYSVFNIGAGLQTAFWDRATYSRIARIKDGRIQWIAGQHDGTKRTEGGATYLWRPLGEVDSTLVVGDVDFQLLAYTNDGFGLGAVTPHFSQAITPENIVQENVQSGAFIKDPQTGKPLVIIGSGTEAVVLEVTGIDPAKMERIGGEVQLTNSVPKSPPAPGQYTLVYRTWPDRDGGRYYWVTGDGWGWRPDVPWLEIKDGVKHVADVRLRRDAGALWVYATVLDPAPFAEGAPAQFGKSTGLEVLIGPAAPANRTAPVTGDTRFFLTATRQGDDLKGVLLANRPADGSPDFKPVPGAKIAARESLNGYGYHLEAEIPLASLPELTLQRDVNYIRNYQPGAKRAGDWLETYTQNRPDLPGPVRLNLAIWANAGGTVTRTPWVPDGESASDPVTTTNPARWGAGNQLVTLHWPYTPGAEVHIYRGSDGKLEDATLLSTVSDTDNAADTPGIGAFTYWVETLPRGAAPQLFEPEQVELNAGTSSEPALNFVKSHETAALPLAALQAQSVFPGGSNLVDVAIATKALVATSSSPQITVSTSRLDESRWRVVLRAADDLPTGFHATIGLIASEAGGKTERGNLEISGTAVALAGLLENTGGVLPIDSSQLADAKPAATIGWSGSGSLERRAVGSSGYVLFRHNGYFDSVPTRRIQPPFSDTFSGADGFWYGDDGSNMRFDVDGLPGKDPAGGVRLGSVNSNDGTPDLGPGVKWNIKVTDTAPHLLTVFTPGKAELGAKERYTLTSSGGDSKSVEFDSSQGGAIIQFEFIGNATLSVVQTVGGIGSTPVGANCGALFLD